MDFITNLILLIARLCFAVAFLWSAIDKISNWRGAVSYMELKKIPMISTVLPIAIALQMLGGVSILLGFHSHLGAFILLLYTVPTAIKMHDFWTMSGEARITEKMLFLKDVAIVGGLLFILALGAGNFSLSP